jgi:hypothetical protein
MLGLTLAAGDWHQPHIELMQEDGTVSKYG